MKKDIIDIKYKKYITLCNQARRCLENTSYTESIKRYKKAIAIYPHDYTEYYNMGVAFSDLKDYKTAIQYYDREIALNPDHRVSYHNKSLDLASLGQNDLALEYFDKALEFNPKRYEDMCDEAIREADEEMESCITKEIEEYINQGGVLN